MVWYAPMMPHDPHTPPEALLARYRDKTPSIHQARYWAMVEWFDQTCGQLLDYLEQNHLSENTVVAYVTDNGWIQDLNSPKYAPRSKQSQYDGGLRSPIMVRWKGKIAPRMETVQLASSLDITPTILKACGVEIPPLMEGINLFDASAVQKRSSVHGECFTHDAVDLDAPEKSLRWRWIIEGWWKLVVPDPINEPTCNIELYDLSKDPGEENNLAAAQPERVLKLKAQLDARWNPAR